MMAKPIKALELHYPMIQFLIKMDVYFSRYSSNSSGHRMSCIFAVLVRLSAEKLAISPFSPGLPKQLR